MSGIRIIGMKPINKGTLKAFLKVEIVKWGLQVNGIKLFRSAKSSWIRLPDKEYLSGGEKKKYAPVIEFRDEAVFPRFQAAVLKAVAEYEPTDSAF